MPIEFRCSGCNQLLRVPDTAAGQQAKCPNCASVQNIPAASTVAPPPPPAGPADSANPFAAPSPIREEYVAGAMPGDSERTGPPWEREGKSFETYFSTLKLILMDPVRMFSTMRREGGLGAPTMYYLCGMLAAWVVSMALMFGLTTLLNVRIGGKAEELLASFAGLACATVLLPLFAIVWLYLVSGILHLSLMIVGGARQAFDTTFRVVAYVGGVMVLVSLLPYISAIAGIAQLVYMIFGVMHAHEISGGKATLAVLLPALCCCGLLIFGLMTFLVVGFSAHN